MSNFLKIFKPKNKKQVFNVPVDTAVNLSPLKNGLPLPVFRAVEFVEKYMDVEGIYRVSGSVKIVSDIQKMYDSGISKKKLLNNKKKDKIQT